MQTASRSKMVNGRVDEQAVAKATRVLEGNGLTVSAFIRNSIEYVASTGEVPSSGLPAQREGVDRDRLRRFVRDIEQAPMPGKADYPNLSGDALVERLRMERYGYR